MPYHKHHGGLNLYVLEGELNFVDEDWVAGPGTYVFEPPGNTHVELSDRGVLMLAWSQGPLEFLNPDNTPVEVRDCVAWKAEIEAYHRDRGSRCLLRPDTSSERGGGLELAFETAGAPARPGRDAARSPTGSSARGPATVLCLHGFPDHPVGDDAARARALAESGHRVVCPALPGYWPSSAVEDGDYAVGRWRHDLLEVMTAIGLDRRVARRARLGSVRGYYLAARQPERLSSSSRSRRRTRRASSSGGSCSRNSGPRGTRCCSRYRPRPVVAATSAG